MTQLPDGSGCCTATIMSRDEAMALPLKERPLNHRISSEMYHAVFEAIGEASMCWNPRPSGQVFASEQASDVAVRLCFKIADELERQQAGSARCRICNKTALEINGYLHRVNELGVAGVWECRPSCDADMKADDRLLAAIEGA